MMLVGGAITILKNMKVNGKDYPKYIMENKKNWNHQPVQLMVKKSTNYENYQKLMVKS